MAHRRTDVMDAIRQVAAEQGAACAFRTGNKRGHAVLSIAGRSRKIFFGCSPSDRNAHKSVAHYTRRLLNQMRNT
jgi:hypothetical protein